MVEDLLLEFSNTIH